MVSGKPISFWANIEQEEELRRRAKKEKRTVSDYIKLKIFKNEN